MLSLWVLNSVESNDPSGSASWVVWTTDMCRVLSPIKAGFAVLGLNPNPGENAQGGGRACPNRRIASLFQVTGN